MKKFYKIWRKGLSFPVLFAAGFITAQIFNLPLTVLIICVILAIAISFEIYAYKKGWE